MIIRDPLRRRDADLLLHRHAHWNYLFQRRHEDNGQDEAPRGSKASLDHSQLEREHAQDLCDLLGRRKLQSQHRSYAYPESGAVMIVPGRSLALIGNASGTVLGRSRISIGTA